MITLRVPLIRAHSRIPRASPYVLWGQKPNSTMALAGTPFCRSIPRLRLASRPWSNSEIPTATRGAIARLYSSAAAAGLTSRPPPRTIIASAWSRRSDTIHNLAMQRSANERVAVANARTITTTMRLIQPITCLRSLRQAADYSISRDLYKGRHSASNLSLNDLTTQRGSTTDPIRQIERLDDRRVTLDRTQRTRW